MGVFLFSAIRKGQKPFTSGFYRLYVLLTVVDIGNLLWSTFFVTAFPIVRGLLVASPLLVNINPCGSMFLRYLQTFLRTTLTANRFCVFVMPQHHEKLFGKMYLKFIIILNVASSMALISFRPFYSVEYGITNTSVEMHYTNTGVQKVIQYINMSTRYGPYILNFAMQVATIWNYYEYNRKNPSASASVKLKRRSEMRLVVYTLLEFIFETIMVAYLVVTAYGSFGGDQSYQAWAREYLGWANDLICVCGSAFLFITSEDVRRGFCQFYGIPWDKLPRVLKADVSSASRSSTIAPANVPS